MNPVKETIKAKDDLAVATDRAEKAEQSLKEAQEKISGLETSNSEATGKIAALEKEKTELQGKVDAATKKAEETEKDVDRRAGLKAAAQLAKVGIKPVAETPDAAVSKADLWAQYQAIQDAKGRREFYLKHKDQM